MMRQPSTIEFVAFCLQQSPGVGPVALRAALSRIAREGLSPEAFLSLDDRGLQSRFGLKPPAIAALRQPDQDTLSTWDRLRADYAKILLLGQPGYPHRLASLAPSAAPPLLFVLGDLDILQHPAVGFCGSRRASDKGLQAARDCARLLAAEHINVVSGYACGIDLAAHRAALEAGGTTTLVLAEGIFHFRLKEELHDLASGGDMSRLLVVSEFPPGLPWRAHNAMARNSTICGLSHAMILIESGLEGGTFEAGKTALEIGEPLFCVEYAEPSPAAEGNPYFLQHGAFSLKRSRNGQPSLCKLISVVRDGGTPTLEPGLQRELTLREEPEP
jgi:DNA protecting protein DprA